MIAGTKGAPVADLILEIIEGGEPGRQIELVDSIEVGRDASAAVALEDDQVSRRHARISVQGGQAVAEDLGSTNGTYVNDQPISGARPLQADDRIRIGGTVFQLRTTQQVAIQATAVRPVPDVTAVSHGVLQPASAEELTPPRAATSDAPRVDEREAAFVPDEVVEDADARSDYNAIARLVDPSVKKQTNVAVIALLGAAGLAVLIAFGLK
jgi:pSer/pThr/pTyr-binding forkhead associated (FHA) protein